MKKISKTIGAGILGATLLTGCAGIDKNIKIPEIVKKDKTEKIDKNICYINSQIFDLIENYPFDSLKPGEECEEKNIKLKNFFTEAFKNPNFTIEKGLRYLVSEGNKDNISEEDWVKIQEKANLEGVFDPTILGLEGFQDMAAAKFHQVLDIAGRYKEIWNEIKLENGKKYFKKVYLIEKNKQNFTKEQYFTKEKYQQAFTNYLNDKNIENKTYNINEFKDNGNEFVKKYLEEKTTETGNIKISK